MELQDLRTSASKLSDAELLGLLKDIRSNRRIAKPKSYGAKPTTTKKVAAAPSIDAMLASASPDLIAQMIATLEAQKKG
jgi:hypothetical protein